MAYKILEHTSYDIAKDADAICYLTEKLEKYLVSEIKGFCENKKIIV